MARELDWNPERYEQFAAERAQPFYDLLAGVEPAPGGRVVDLGCGTGKLTRHLHERTGAATTLGVDVSDKMLAKAEEEGGLVFRNEDIATFEPDAPFDVVFSNAALQWLPDHASLFAKVAEWVAPGGQLAVQVPANQHHPSQTVAARIAEEEFGIERRKPSVLRPDDYATILHRLGFAAPIVRLHVYLHELAGPEEVIDWVSGTLLRGYRARLEADDFERFLATYRDRLLAELPADRPFPFTFPRILLWARKPV